MSDALNNKVEFPDKPDKRVARPRTPAFEKTGTVKIYGYIGEVTKDFVNLHQMHDHRAYYQIPRDGIVSINPKVCESLKHLYELEVFAKTPIRYYHATTAELTAGALAHAVHTFNEYSKGHRKPTGTTRCPGCPSGCCCDGVCVCAPVGFPIGDGHAKMYGLTVSKPEPGKES
jgi:hypothetical protein